MLTNLSKNNTFHISCMGWFIKQNRWMVYLRWKFNSLQSIRFFVLAFVGSRQNCIFDMFLIWTKMPGKQKETPPPPTTSKQANQNFSNISIQCACACQPADHCIHICIGCILSVCQCRVMSWSSPPFESIQPICYICLYSWMCDSNRPTLTTCIGLVEIIHIYSEC